VCEEWSAIKITFIFLSPKMQNALVVECYFLLNQKLEQRVFNSSFIRTVIHFWPIAITTIDMFSELIDSQQYSNLQISSLPDTLSS